MTETEIVKETPAEETAAGATDENAFNADSFLDSIHDDPVFRYRYLGDRDALADEELSDEDFNRIGLMEEPGEQRAALNDLIKQKARSMVEKYLAQITDGEAQNRIMSDVRKGMRGRLAKLGELDERYKFDFGDKGEDYLDLDDKTFAEHPSGKLVKHLKDMGFTWQQIQNFKDDVLYGIAAERNGHENEVIKRSITALKSPDGKHPAVLVSSKSVGGGDKTLEDLYRNDPEKWREIVDKAAGNRDIEKMKLYRKIEDSIGGRS